jgi:N-acetylglucosamine-6-phosphate deacetylase
MPRAELPVIIPLRQFGEDTWLAPGFIEPVGDARASFALNGETVVVRDGRCARADGRLAGACLAMASAVRNCVRLLSVPLTTALRFASTHPAEFLGLGDRLGKLATGYRADMVALDGAAIAVLDTGGAGAGGER